MADDEHTRRTTELDIDFSLEELEDVKEEVEEAPPEEEPEELPQEEASFFEKNKKLIIIAVAVFLSIIITVIIYFVFIKTDEPVQEEKKEEVKKEEPKKEEPLPIVEKKKEYVPPVTYEVKPFLIPIKKEGEIQFLNIALYFILSNEYVKKDLDKNIITLRQNIIYVLRRKDESDFQDTLKKERMKQEIITAANRVLQRGSVYKVFFTSFFLR